MSRLGDALVARNEMRMRFEEAKHELMEATLEAIEQSDNGLTAREIAGEADVPTCAVMGTVQSAIRRGLMTARRERQTIEYVMIAIALPKVTGKVTKGFFVYIMPLHLR